MNIIRKLTLRYMKQNKSRTLVTMIGVIIAVAMLTAVSTLAVSFLDGMKRQTIAESGEWHATYEDVNVEQLKDIRTDSATKHVMLSKELGYAELENSDNQQKPYIFAEAFNEDRFERFPVHLAAGRFPKAENEIIISEELNKRLGADYDIGEELSLELGERVLLDDETALLDQTSSLAFDPEQDKLQEKLEVNKKQAYTIVGMMERPGWEPPQAPGFTVLSYLDEETLDESQTADASVTWKKVNKNQKEHAGELGGNLGVTVDFNQDLLRFDGLISDRTRQALFTFAALIMAIIVIGSVSLIYNAFSISVAERSKYLGMLSSVGATKKQKRNSVFFEGIIIGLISIPLGVLAGVGGIGMTLKFINPMMDEALRGVTAPMRVIVTPWSLGIACLIAMLTILLSAYIPARRASKTTAINAIRQTEDIKLTRKKVKTNRFVRKVFGFEAEIALKNLKRNKRKYVATVFSLAISVVLFLSVSFFTNSVKKVNDMTMDNPGYDIEINQSNQTDEEWERLVEQTTELDNVTDYTVSHTLDLSTSIKANNIDDALKDVMDVTEEGELNFTMLIRTLDSETLKGYAKATGRDEKVLKDTSGLPGIVINKASFGLDEKHYDIEPLDESLDKIKLYDDMDEETYFVDTIEPVVYTNQVPTGASTENMNALNLIVSEKTYHAIMENVQDDDGFKADSKLYLKSDDPIEVGEEIDDIKEVALSMTNHSVNRQEEAQLMLMMSVFIYGFITLITLVSVANIFNTISTSITLRKREFAMLKSMGMTPKGFNKMIHYESIFYGMKALLYGLPISIGLMYLMHKALSSGFQMAFQLPWVNIGFVIIALFMIVGVAMLYASNKVRKENIIDVLKREND